VNRSRIKFTFFLSLQPLKNTREEILRAVYADMQINGFQGTRPDKVIRELGITKGALYHYFPGKLALGYAIVDEIIAPTYLGYWRELENYPGNPVDFLLEMVQSISNACSQKRMLVGSPLSNLIQEMSPLDEGFRKPWKKASVTDRSGRTFIRNIPPVLFCRRWKAVTLRPKPLWTRKCLPAVWHP
jgi:AcrR family transcriptional regulator